MVVAVMLGVAGLVGLGVAALARRWPVVAAPKVQTADVVAQVDQHPSLVAHLRRRYDPQTQTGVALIAATAVAIGGAAAVGALLAMVDNNALFARFDARFAQFGADHASAWTTQVLKAVSLFLGSTPAVITLAVVITTIEMIRKPSRMLPLFVAVALVGQFLLSNSIKLIVQRDRPDVMQLTHAAGSSFPSGHSCAAAASMATFALVIGRDRGRGTRIALAGVAAGLAAAVACSRVLLGVHWFTDVLAGLALGWAWFAICSIAFGGRLLRFGEPVETAEAVVGHSAAGGDPPSAAVLAEPPEQIAAGTDGVTGTTRRPR